MKRSPEEQRSAATSDARSDPRGMGPRKERRALSHVGGPAELEGDAKAAAKLSAALDVPTSAEAEEQARAHVHGFHSYPARMHPSTARRLIEAFSAPGERVLDPFCGSGTVLVEAKLLKREAVGVDANPLAVKLARLKTRAWSEAERAHLVEAARRAAALSDERREAKTGASKRYGPEDMALFDAHVLFELDGLRMGIDREPDVEALRALSLVLSSILIKVSRRASDTSGHNAPRRIAAGYPARLFVRKTEELTRRMAEVEGALAKGKRATVLDGDARALDGVADSSIDLVVTSPPYPGVYDYLEHHEARLRWLRLRADRFNDAEIGARRHLDPLGPARGRDAWRDEIGAALRAMRRVLREGGLAVLLIADSVVAGAPVFAVDLLRRVAPSAGLSLVAIASQARPHFHGPTARAFAERPRREHAVLLERI